MKNSNYNEYLLWKKKKKVLWKKINNASAMSKVFFSVNFRCFSSSWIFICTNFVIRFFSKEVESYYNKKKKEKKKKKKKYVSLLNNILQFIPRRDNSFRQFLKGRETRFFSNI